MDFRKHFDNILDSVLKDFLNIECGLSTLQVHIECLWAGIVDLIKQANTWQRKLQAEGKCLSTNSLHLAIDTLISTH